MQSSCQTEYDQLEEVIVCPPKYMSIKEVINSIQAHYKDMNIHIPTALEQHDQFKKTLTSLGVNVHEVAADSTFPEQVFTRDIGFVIDDVVYLAALERPIRQGEEQVLRKYLEEKNLSYQPIEGGTIEGGDVVIDGDDIFIGISSRTSNKIVERIQQNHPTKKVHPIYFDSSYLHLDCVFNPVSENVALVYSDAIKPEHVEWLRKKYTLIEVSKKEQFSLAVNVLSLGNENIIVLPENNKTNEQLREKGFKLHEVAFSEIIKSGGSFRCVTMPLKRGS
ncbi:dimethylarginine dimethylaminohydrolase family protein [Alkalicoccobacillus murimartini]|uniref:N-dimethylarginine dimethylaminohydrolase n=1 Tax=Alkalicoccobacillus murimartini TaxID=171685 RepID=A0ABT9YL78_9BACI|nr:arginine deiminase family protein [Alkalicoccobacillus murimartini]MDQ0207957.1 N-dimethylarginine dimethylaminohydrolase [Alkalicoccobacillus murimartini]